MVVERHMYRGSPILRLKSDEADKFPFSIGVRKATLILMNIDEIRSFVEDNPKWVPYEKKEEGFV